MSGEEVSNPVPQISAFAMAAIRLLPIANRFNRYLGTITHLIPSLESVNREFSQKYTGTSKATKKLAAERSTPRLRNEIKVDGVWFQYENSSQWILKNASLEIPAGQSVGIIGPSGSGKATLIDLLLGLLTPGKGKILADGKDIFDTPEEWLHRIGYISQPMYLTEDSLKRNIAFGLDDDEIDEKKVMDVLNMACLEDFLSDLPDGIETRVDEFGTKLSGGQKQRACIARALYFDPEILILDEAASALDYETEKEIMENISCLKGKLTMVIIAHRLQTIKECDAVYMVRKGRIERQQ